jgi:phosphatidylserine/phosphatidylglycerophosphate/cardiolipin synthase-like enzyme
LDKIQEVEDKIDVVIKKDYIKGTNIAHQLKLYSVNKKPHVSIVGAIARSLKFKIDYKNYYQDDYIAIVGEHNDGNDYWQVYYKPMGADMIIEWFEKNKKDVYYEVIYKRGQRAGEVKEKGYTINSIAYKVN